MKPIATALLLSTFFACSAVPPEPVDVIPPGPDAGIGDDDSGPTTVALEINQPQSPTYWGSSVVTGSGPAGGILLAHSPLHGELPAVQIPSSGEFCIDVPLQLGGTNKLSFTAIGADGTMSEQIIKEVVQDGEPPEIETETDVSKVAREVSGDFILNESSSSILQEGNDFSQLFDGNEQEFLVLDEAFWADADWLAFQIPERIEFHQMKISTGIDCPMESFDIYVSDFETPEDPFLYLGGGGYPVYSNQWSRVATVTGNTKTDIDITPNPRDTKARHFAIVFNSNDCAPWYEDGEHQISEVTLWALEDDGTGSTPTSRAPSCASGGN